MFNSFISPIITPLISPHYTTITPRYRGPSTLVIDVETRTPIISPLHSPLSTPLIVSPFRSTTTYTTPSLRTPAIVSMFDPLRPVLTVSSVHASDIESGLNYDPLAQEQIRDYIHNTFLNKWLPKDFPSVLRHLKVVDGKVKVVQYSSSKDKDGNKIVDETSKEDNEKKLDFIEEHILDKHRTRKVLVKIITENNMKWYNLPHNEGLVKNFLAHYVKGKLEEMVNA